MHYNTIVLKTNQNQQLITSTGKCINVTGKHKKLSVYTLQRDSMELLFFLCFKTRCHDFLWFLNAERPWGELSCGHRNCTRWLKDLSKSWILSFNQWNNLWPLVWKTSRKLTDVKATPAFSAAQFCFSNLTSHHILSVCTIGLYSVESVC